jgi:hypothetical protein
LNLFKLKDKLVKLCSYYSSLSYLSDPVRVNNRIEYYKNGNVKAYISVLSISKPYKSIKVRNRAYDLYKSNFQEAKTYLAMLYYSDQYESNLSIFYNKISKIHCLAEGKVKFIDSIKLGKIEKIKVDIRKYSLNDLKMPLKPKRISEKYHYKCKFFPSFFKRERRKKFLKLKILRNDMNFYRKRVKEYNEQRLNDYIKEREYFVKKYKEKTRINKIKDTYDLIKSNFIKFENENDVSLYLDTTLVSLFSDLSFYNDMNYKYHVDIDYKGIILDIYLPNINKFPKTERFNIVKKYLDAKPVYLNENELYDYINEAINSLVYYFILSFHYINMEDTIKSLYINLYRTKCWDKAHISMMEIKDIKEKNDLSVMKTLYGKYLDIREEKEVIPTRKGAM